MIALWRINLVALWANAIYMPLAAQDTPLVFRQAAMGTWFQIKVYAPDAASAGNAARKAMDRIIALDRVLSDYREDAEVYQLNHKQSSNWTPISSDLAFVLRRSMRLSKWTGRCFDPTLGSLTQLWRRARRRDAYPDDSLQVAAWQKSGIGFVRLRKSRGIWYYRCQKKGLQLDFGGVGKGFALDEALATLHDQGIKHAMVTSGSTVAFGEAPPPRNGWTLETDVGILKEIHLHPVRNTTLSISGDDAQYLDWRGERYSHVLDPRNGLPLREGNTCLVIGSTGLMTDALSTAFSVMEPAKIRKVLTRWKGMQVLCLRQGKVVFSTAGRNDVGEPLWVY